MISFIIPIQKVQLFSYKYGSPYLVCREYCFAFFTAFSASTSSEVLSSLLPPNG